MYVHQIDFFKETSQIFASKIMHIAKEIVLDQGAFIFHEGDPASRLFILRRGSVRLSIGQTGQVVYIINRSGETFGWSSLMGRESYSASAEVLERTDLTAFERDEFLEVIKSDPKNGIMLYKGLAATLANRLLQLYQVITDASYSADFPSEGSRQMQTSDETD